MTEIEVRLDLPTAKAIADAIYMLGEHISAGVPIPDVDNEFNELLGGFYRDLREKLRGLDATSD
jgi:hypothetical protein